MPITHQDPQEVAANNKVLQKAYKPSTNFWQSDLLLQHFVSRNFSGEGAAYMEAKWIRLGKQAATEIDHLSQLADKNPPTLIKRNQWGETLNEIQFHPAYDTLTSIAVESEMFRVKWEPTLRARFEKERHRLGFVSDFLFNMSEGGLPCPLCMTDGAARLIDRYCEPDDRERLLQHIYTSSADDLYTGAMFLTEKRGGSDVGANLVTATHIEGKYYALNGEKWFCSNANAEIIFVLARTNPEVPGTRGLSIFLVEKNRPDGTRNTMDIVRLKDKLGVRSMASAECILQDTWGKLVGEEGTGFKLMTDMINLSRLYNAIASLSEMRRGLIEAYTFLEHRESFGKPAMEHALIRQKLWELGSKYVANFYLCWHAVRLLDDADSGSAQATEILRLLTPMVKKEAALTGVYLIRESMELMGGLGYIEDTVMPKLMRDTMVLPIWEGAGNIMVLDMLRASAKSQGLNSILRFIEEGVKTQAALADWKKELNELKEIAAILFKQEQDVMETTAFYFFERLTLLYQISLMLTYQDEKSRSWIAPAVQYFTQQKEKQLTRFSSPPEEESIRQLIGWDLAGPNPAK